MTVYLIHLDRKVHHAQHYLGSTDDLNARIAEHSTSTWDELTTPVVTPTGGVRRGQTTGKAIRSSPTPTRAACPGASRGLGRATGARSDA